MTVTYTSVSPRYTTHRPRCRVCDKPLVPAESSNDGELCFRGFWPCPEHPNSEPVYPPIQGKP